MTNCYNPSMLQDLETAEDPIWCVVGNVAKTHTFGPNHEIRHGAKLFSAGTKLYIIPISGGVPERMRVCGRSRGGRYIEAVIKTNMITNWRVKAVYAPPTHKINTWYWGSREEAQAFVDKKIAYLEG